MIQCGYVVDHDGGYEAVVLQDVESGDTLELQRAFEFDAQDVLAGMNTYCLVRQGASFYGGVLEWRLAGETLMLRLSAQASSTLGLPEVLNLQLGPDVSTDLRTHLASILDEWRAT